MKRTLLSYARIVTSQLGEDGIIDELIRRIGIGSDPKGSWLVDVGAGDGVTNSNTHHLRLRGWGSVNIECDKEKFEELRDYALALPSLQGACFHQAVTVEPGSLDSILDRVAEFPQFYHLLNLDVDGPDYWVWKHHTGYRPMIVVVEVHGGIPPGKMAVHGRESQYSSWSAMLKLAGEKGYTLAASLGNMIFVDRAHVAKVGLTKEELENPDLLWVPPHVRGLLTPMLLAKRDFDRQFDEAMKRFARCPTYGEQEVQP